MSPQQAILSKSIPEPNSGCWIWLGSGRTYGQTNWHETMPLYGEALAHRWSYRAFLGPIPKGMFVCHRCDTPPCVNPDHLFIGTAGDNARDMVRKGRHARQRPKT
jgi:hypothetical protein